MVDQLTLTVGLADALVIAVVAAVGIVEKVGFMVGIMDVVNATEGIADGRIVVVATEGIPVILVGEKLGISVAEGFAEAVGASVGLVVDGIADLKTVGALDGFAIEGDAVCGALDGFTVGGAR